MMRAIGYCRISTEAQSDGLGLDVQREQVRDHCADRGYELVKMCEDVTSGTHGLEHREGLAEALTLLASGEAEVMVIPRLDRLARDLVMSEQLLREVWRVGEVESCARGEADLKDDPSDPTHRLIRQVLGAVAEFERAMISLRMKRGRMAKRARGEFAVGSPPYGFRATGRGDLEPDPAEQAGLELIAELRRRGRSIREVRDELNDAGVPTKHEGGSWHTSNLGRVVQRMEAHEAGECIKGCAWCAVERAKETA